MVRKRSPSSVCGAAGADLRLRRPAARPRAVPLVEAFDGGDRESPKDRLTHGHFISGRS